MDDTTVVAVDVGGTTIKAARVDRAGRSLAELTMPTGHGDEAISKLMSICDELHDSTTVAATIATPGIIDEARGIVRHGVNLGWRDVPIASLVEQETGMPTSLVHDVRAACAAELALGHGRDVDDMLMVVIGTGLAAGIVSGGRVVRGASGSAGEIGHLVVRSDGEYCPCGQRGCAEVYASAGGISRRYVQLGGDGTLSVARIVESRDARALSVWRDATSALAAVLAATVVTLDPSLIVIAGGVSRAGDSLVVPVERELAALLRVRTPPRIEISKLNSRAGLVGAAIEAWSLAGHPDVAQSWTGQLALMARND